MFAVLLMLALTLCCAGAMAADFHDYANQYVRLDYNINPLPVCQHYF